MTQRIRVTTTTLVSIGLFVTDCPTCGVVYAMSEDYEDRRRADGKSWYCPNGDRVHFTKGMSDADKLAAAQARNTHLEDQLYAAAVEAEHMRGLVIRDRARFAAGVCPCCRRSFDNVRRHMSDQHPDYTVQRTADLAKSTKALCSCGRGFDTIGGLHNHQTRQRASDWWKDGTSAWSAHLTKVGS